MFAAEERSTGVGRFLPEYQTHPVRPARWLVHNRRTDGVVDRAGGAAGRSVGGARIVADAEMSH